MPDSKMAALMGEARAREKDAWLEALVGRLMVHLKDIRKAKEYIEVKDA